MQDLQQKGSLIALLAKTTNKKFLSVSLGLSAGVMIYVSMVELFADAKNSLILALERKKELYYSDSLLCRNVFNSTNR